MNDGPCTTYVGPIGAGNYVKMVHNGIEYGDMQLIAEAYDVLKTCAGTHARGMGIYLFIYVCVCVRVCVKWAVAHGHYMWFGSGPMDPPPPPKED